MHGMFRANGGCGYVRKPDFLMSHGPDNQVFDPKAKLPVKKTLKVPLFYNVKKNHNLANDTCSKHGRIILQVKVFLGDGWHLDFKQTHFDLYSPPDFYTRVSYATFSSSKFFCELVP